MTWLIDNLDASVRELTYVVDPCDCNNVGGWTETLASMVYTDDGNSPATIPSLPTSISVEVVDPIETCGSPSVNLGEKQFDKENSGERTIQIVLGFIFCAALTSYGVWYDMAWHAEGYGGAKPTTR